MASSASVRTVSSSGVSFASSCSASTRSCSVTAVVASERSRACASSSSWIRSCSNATRVSLSCAWSRISASRARRLRHRLGGGGGGRVEGAPSLGLRAFEEHTREVEPGAARPCRPPRRAVELVGIDPVGQQEREGQELLLDHPPVAQPDREAQRLPTAARGLRRRRRGSGAAAPRHRGCRREPRLVPDRAGRVLRPDQPRRRLAAARRAARTPGRGTTRSSSGGRRGDPRRSGAP